MEIDKCLKRIEYNGNREPNVENLQLLSYAYKLAVPYSSLQFWGGKRTVLDVEAIYQKIVIERQGGICCELNYLFMWILRKLGYKVKFFEADFYQERSEKFTRDHHHMVLLVELSGDQYYVDPGWITFGPMKLELMSPYVETHGRYRFRTMHDRDGWCYIERHKKTILDVEGNISKKGPATSVTGFCDSECAKEESQHWTFLFRFNTLPANSEDFQDCIDFLHDNDQSTLYHKILLMRFEPKKMLRFFDDCFVVREIVDPNTDKIITEVKISTDEELLLLARQKFKCEIKHKLTYFSVKNRKACQSH